MRRSAAGYPTVHSPAWALGADVAAHGSRRRGAGRLDDLEELVAMAAESSQTSFFGEEAHW